MKINARILPLLACAAIASSAAATEKIRTISEILGFPQKVLKRTLSRTIYRELLVSPLEGYVAVRGQLSGTHIYGARVIHSDLGDAYDNYALQLARDWQISGHFDLGKLSPSTPVVLYVLIYEIADGTMAVSFPSFDDAGGTQLEYYGAAKLAVQQMNGKWADLKLPGRPTATGSHATVSGNGWAVRDGLANNFELQMKLNQISSTR
jgi:hypothetical protein